MGERGGPASRSSQNLGGRFGMYRRFSVPIITGLVIAYIALTVTGCAATKSRRASLQNRMDDSAGSFQAIGEQTLAEETPSETVAEFETRPPGDQDPFGFIPADWPDNIPLHPKAIVAHSGTYGRGGYYLLTLISPELATTPGVQNFYVDALSQWTTLQVVESPEGDENEYGVLTLVAGNPGAVLRIVAERADPSVVENLADTDFWKQVVSSEPVAVRLFYAPDDS